MEKDAARVGVLPRNARFRIINLLFLNCSQKSKFCQTSSSQVPVIIILCWYKSFRPCISLTFRRVSTQKKKIEYWSWQWEQKIQFCALVGSLKWSTPLDLERHKKEFALRNRFWSACYKKKKNERKTTRAATIATRNISFADTKVLFMRISLAKKSNLIIN